MNLDNFKPRSDYHLVEWVEPATESAGGIALPETAQKNHVECRILKSGPGMYSPIYEFRSPMWGRPGENIVIEKHTFIPLVGTKKGLVRDCDIVAIVTDGGWLCPMNDWVKIEVPEMQEKIGSIYLAEIDQQKVNEGKILALGPGRVCQKGNYSGVRHPICDIMGIEWALGVTAFWDEKATILEIGQNSVECVFIRASELLCIKTSETEEN